MNDSTNDSTNEMIDTEKKPAEAGNKTMHGAPILKSRKFLYMTEFFSGMSVMAAELGASRLLAPYFSSSQIVWTIIIGTIMIAMALGNIYGGRSADRRPDPDRLYLRILAAGIWLALIPVLGKYVIVGISGLVILSVSGAYLVWAALAACLVVFVFPLFLLGTVTPSLAKYTTESLEENGRVIGRLGAANTVGSIIGTFTPTFVTIPAVGTSVTILIFAGILILLSAVYFLSIKRHRTRIWIFAAIFAVCCVSGRSDSFAFWEKDLAYEGESVYNYLQVKEDDDSVALSTNVLFGVQSVLMKNDSLTGMYYDYAMAAPLMTGKDPADVDVLILGMGTGTYATQCRRFFGTKNIEGVEIDDKITDLAHEYFKLSDDVPVTTCDGRAFIALTDEKYDVIMVDAYQDITIPFQMSSVEFFELVRDHLVPGGVMVVNMNMRNEGEDGINQYLTDTISSVFPEIYTIDVPGATNRELFASENGDMLQNLEAGAENVENARCRELMKKTCAGLTRPETGDRVMTDDKAPVELLGMRAIDGIIGSELDYYRDIYDEDGVRGLLDEILQ